MRFSRSSRTCALKSTTSVGILDVSHSSSGDLVQPRLWDAADGRLRIQANKACLEIVGHEGSQLRALNDKNFHYAATKMSYKSPFRDIKFIIRAAEVGLTVQTR